MSNIYLTGFGFHVPESVVTNADLEKIVDTSDEWIRTRTGIHQRHFAKKGEVTSDLSATASKMALDGAGLEADDLTHIIHATLTPDTYCPPSATILEHKLGTKHKAAFDLNAACSGFVNALEAARGIVSLNPENKVLIAAAEVLSSRLNWEDRTTCVLFGDGAGATIVTGEKPENGAEVKDVILKSDGALWELLTIKGGGALRPYKLGEAVAEDFFVQMQGRDVYKFAVRSMSSITMEILEKNGFEKKDVDLFIPHQANIRIIDSVANKLELTDDQVYINVDKYGNTSAASVPLALAEAFETGAIKKGDLVLVATFGGGFTWGAALLQF